MMIGFTSDKYKNLPIFIVLSTLKWCGVSFSEVTISVFNDPLRVFQSARGMRLGLHLPNIGNFGFDFSSLGFRGKIESVLSRIEKYKNIFCFEYAVFHPPEGQPEKTSFEYYVHNLKQVNIPLILENTRDWDVSGFINFYERIENELGSKLKGICLDIPHAYLAGLDWIKFYRVLGKRVKIIHLSDCADNKDLHLPFGIGGELSLNNILVNLKLLGFKGIINFEIKPQSLGDMETVFKTYMRTIEFFNLESINKLRFRMKFISIIGKIIYQLLRK